MTTFTLKIDVLQYLIPAPLLLLDHFMIYLNITAINLLK